MEKAAPVNARRPKRSSKVNAVEFKRPTPFKDKRRAGQSSRLVLELGREAVRTRPFEVPSTFVADPSGFGDAHRLRNNA